MKVVINKGYGGFCISKEAAEFMAQRGNKRAAKELEKYEKEKRWFGYGFIEDLELDQKQGSYGYDRTDKDLIAAVEELGNKADGKWATLVIVEIPDDVKWEIEVYDGFERIREKSRSW